MNNVLFVLVVILLLVYLNWKKKLLSLPFHPYKKVLLHTQDHFSEIWIAEHNHLRTLQFDDLKNNIQTCCDLKYPRRIVFIYQKMIIMATTLVQDPKRICIVGLGGGTLSMHLRYLYPEAHLTHIEINSRMLDYAKKFFFFQPDDRMEFYFEDAAVFFQTQQGRVLAPFDLIVLDAFDNDCTPTRFFHTGFYQGLSSKLTEQGVMIGNTFYYSVNKDREQLLYQHIFKRVLSCPPIDSSEGNRILIAFNEIKLNARDLEKRMRFLQPWLEHMDLPQLYWKKWLYAHIKNEWTE